MSLGPTAAAVLNDASTVFVRVSVYVCVCLSLPARVEPDVCVYLCMCGGRESLDDRSSQSVHRQ